MKNGSNEWNNDECKNEIELNERKWILWWCRTGYLNKWKLF